MRSATRRAVADRATILVSSAPTRRISPERSLAARRLPRLCSWRCSFGSITRTRPGTAHLERDAATSCASSAGTIAHSTRCCWPRRSSGWPAAVRPDAAQLVGAVLFLGRRRRLPAGRARARAAAEPARGPREPAAVVDAGPYRRVRHPMYRAELAMAFGAPLTLGAMLTVVLSIVFSALLLQRIGSRRTRSATACPRIATTRRARSGSFRIVY